MPLCYKHNRLVLAFTWASSWVVCRFRHVNGVLAWLPVLDTFAVFLSVMACVMVPLGKWPGCPASLSTSGAVGSFFTILLSRFDEHTKNVLTHEQSQWACRATWVTGALFQKHLPWRQQFRISASTIAQKQHVRKMKTPRRAEGQWGWCQGPKFPGLTSEASRVHVLDRYAGFESLEQLQKMRGRTNTMGVTPGSWHSTLGVSSPLAEARCSA